MTLTLKIDLKKKGAKQLVAYLRTLPFVQIEEKDEPFYNPEFVEKVKKAEKEEGIIMNSAEELWDSLPS